MSPLPRTVRRLLLAALLSEAAGSARGQEAAVVLSAQTRPYQEALEGFREAFGTAAASFALPEAPRFAAETRVVVTFGGKALRSRLPGRATLIYALAPGSVVGPQEHEGPRVGVAMVPDPAFLLSRLKALQPGLRRLAVLWSSEAYAPYLRGLEEAARPLGLEITPSRVKTPGELPKSLRGLLGRADALWLPPDPLLLNAENFTALRDFSRANRLPLYAPTESLLELGGAAAVSIGFREMGRAAGLAARKAAAGEAVEGVVVPARAETVVAQGEAARSGLSLSPAELGKADRLLP